MSLRIQHFLVQPKTAANLVKNITPRHHPLVMLKRVLSLDLEKGGLPPTQNLQVAVLPYRMKDLPDPTKVTGNSHTTVVAAPSPKNQLKRLCRTKSEL